MIGWLRELKHSVNEQEDVNLVLMLVNEFFGFCGGLSITESKPIIFSRKALKYATNHFYYKLSPK